MTRFSIITVVFNGELLLEGTILSVLNQTYPNIEYIIVDGASRDGTRTIVQKYAQQFENQWNTGFTFRWLSEPDKGLYDAMNKGQRLATGDFLLFLNAGDHLFATDTLAKIAAQTTTDTDILYGEVMWVDANRKPLGTRSQRTTQQLPEVLTWKSMRYGMVVCHQAFLPRRTIAPSYLENNLSADIDWVIRCLKKATTVQHTHIMVSEFLTGGISKQKHRQSLFDRYAVLKTHFGILPNFCAHIYILGRAMLDFLIKKIA
jgi:glycosyltransferase involved in cell wall biosynthesis